MIGDPDAAMRRGLQVLLSVVAELLGASGDGLLVDVRVDRLHGRAGTLTLAPAGSRDPGPRTAAANAAHIYSRPRP